MEKQIEKRFRLAVKNKGGLSLKLNCPGFTGIPDRLNLLPEGRLFFAEFKFGKGRLTIRQELVHKILRSLGFEVWVVNEKNIEEFLQKL